VPALPDDSRLLLEAWAGLALVSAGLGALVRRAWGARTVDADGWLTAVWLGWAASVALLPVWHLVLPVDGRAGATVAALGVLGLVASGATSWRVLGRGLRRHPLAVLAVVAVALWLANQCLVGPRNGDSGSYHVPTIRWSAAYPAVPGIANLFAAFAYNQSFFLWAAMLDVGPFLHRSHHLANGFLVLLLSARVILGMARAAGPAPCRPADLFFALVLPGLVGLAFDLNLTSPSPDVAVFALEAIVAGELLALVAGDRPPRDALYGLALLAGIGVPVKLSFGGWAVSVPPLALLAVVQREGFRLVPVIVAGVVAALAVVPWMLHGIVLSGYPLYPSTLGAAPVDWRAPLAATIAEANLIRYWNGVPDWWHAALRDPAWFARWLVTLGWLQWDILLPIGLAIVAALTGGVAWCFRRTPRGARAVPVRIVLPTLAALAFCFAAAPRARYGAAAYWILAAEVTVIAVGRASAGVRRALVAVVLGLASLHLRDHPPLLRDLREFEVYARPDLHEVTLPTGLTVWATGPSLCCWDGPFPCTPYPNRALRLRRDGDLASGFAIDPTIPPGPP